MIANRKDLEKSKDKWKKSLQRRWKKQRMTLEERRGSQEHTSLMKKEHLSLKLESHQERLERLENYKYLKRIDLIVKHNKMQELQSERKAKLVEGIERSR